MDKIADIKAFTDAVHSTGMKIMLWFSVPFVGVDSKAFDKFKDKLLDVGTAGGASVVDPRYPQVRSHLISVFKNAVESWGLDGLKLDFIDSFGGAMKLVSGSQPQFIWRVTKKKYYASIAKHQSTNSH